MLSSKIHLPIMMFVLVLNLAFKHVVDRIPSREKEFNKVSILYKMTKNTNNVLRG